jgi:hypothetical protein
MSKSEVKKDDRQVLKDNLNFNFISLASFGLKIEKSLK